MKPCCKCVNKRPFHLCNVSSVREISFCDVSETQFKFLRGSTNPNKFFIIAGNQVCHFQSLALICIILDLTSSSNIPIPFSYKSRKQGGSRKWNTDTLPVHKSHPYLPLRQKWGFRQEEETKSRKTACLSLSQIHSPGRSNQLQGCQRQVKAAQNIGC